VAAREALAHLDYVAWSESARAQTSYTIELFVVRLISDSAHEVVDADMKTRWLTNAEIRSGRCGDGRPVSQSMAYVLDRIDWNLSPSSGGSHGLRPALL
jgi:hypothetical protein